MDKCVRKNVLVVVYRTDERLEMGCLIQRPSLIVQAKGSR